MEESWDAASAYLSIDHYAHWKQNSEGCPPFKYCIFVGLCSFLSPIYTKCCFVYFSSNNQYFLYALRHSLVAKNECMWFNPLICSSYGECFSLISAWRWHWGNLVGEKWMHVDIFALYHHKKLELISHILIDNIFLKSFLIQRILF